MPLVKGCNPGLTLRSRLCSCVAVLPQKTKLLLGRSGLPLHFSPYLFSSADLRLPRARNLLMGCAFFRQPGQFAFANFAALAHPRHFGIELPQGMTGSHVLGL